MRTLSESKSFLHLKDLDRCISRTCNRGSIFLWRKQLQTVGSSAHCVIPSGKTDIGLSYQTPCHLRLLSCSNSKKHQKAALSKAVHRARVAGSSKTLRILVYLSNDERVHVLVSCSQALQGDAQSLSVLTLEGLLHGGFEKVARLLLRTPFWRLMSQVTESTGGISTPMTTGKKDTGFASARAMSFQFQALMSHSYMRLMLMARGITCVIFSFLTLF